MVAPARQPGVVIAHPATQHSYQSALALQERALLQRYITGFYYRTTGVPGAMLGALAAAPALRHELRRRHLDALDDSLIRSLAFEDLVCIAGDRVRLAQRLLEGRDLFGWRMRRFERRVAGLVRRLRPRAVVCYDTCGVGVFDAAHAVGAVCVLDQTTGHLTAAVRAFAEAGVAVPVRESAIARSVAEVMAADVILAPSEYVRRTLHDVGVPEERIRIVPYGADVERFSATTHRPSPHFRVLYVGRLSHRKGIQYLVDALPLLEMANLRMILAGPVWRNADWVREHGERLVYHPPVPHHDVHRLYQDADVYVQPSLHEGSSLTVFEAMASGLPVITTPNSGSVVRDGIEGFVVPARDPSAIADRIRVLYEDPVLRERMGRAARERSQEYTWERYRGRFADVIESVVEGGPRTPGDAPTRREEQIFEGV